MIKINAKRLAKMRKPVEKISKLYGPAQLAQYLVAKLVSGNEVKSMDEIFEFIETVAIATIEDLSDYLGETKSETSAKTSKVVEIEKPKQRKKLFNR